MHSLRLLLALAIIPYSLIAHADTVFVNDSYPYNDKDSIDADLRAECDWQPGLAKSLTEESEGQIRISRDNLATLQAPNLRLTILQVHAIGGGGWTGPKWLRLAGELYNSDKPVLKFTVLRHTSRGKFTACATLKSLAEEVAKDIAEWVQDPKPDARLGDEK